MSTPRLHPDLGSSLSAFTREVHNLATRTIKAPSLIVSAVAYSVQAAELTYPKQGTGAEKKLQALAMTDRFATPFLRHLPPSWRAEVDRGIDRLVGAVNEALGATPAAPARIVAGPEARAAARSDTPPEPPAGA